MMLNICPMYYAVNAMMLNICPMYYAIEAMMLNICQIYYAIEAMMLNICPIYYAIEAMIRRYFNKIFHDQCTSLSKVSITVSKVFLIKGYIFYSVLLGKHLGIKRNGFC